MFQVHPQKESYWGNVNPIGPRACYDEGKRVAETMMYAYHSQSHVDVRVARIFNTFGPRMHPNDGRVVSNFIIQVRLPACRQSFCLLTHCSPVLPHRCSPVHPRAGALTAIQALQGHDLTIYGSGQQVPPIEPLSSPYRAPI